METLTKLTYRRSGPCCGAFNLPIDVVIDQLNAMTLEQNTELGITETDLTPNWKWTTGTLLQSMHNNGTVVYCTMNRREVIGVCMIHHSGYMCYKDSIKITNVYIKPSCRNAGRGTTLLKGAITAELAAHPDIKRILLTSALTFVGDWYDRLGFKPVATDRMLIVTPEVSKNLKPE